jgi:murein endopeptidase
MVGLIQRAAAKVHAQDEEATLFVGDISLPTGEATRWHKSHRHGRDADLIFYAVDENGDPAPMPDHMTPYGEDGHALDPSVPLVFDNERNWMLVKALVQDKEVRVTHIFIANVIRRRLLEFAASQGEPQEIIDRAAQLMAQPGDSAPHNDHMHVRIEGGGQPGFDDGSGDEHELVAARAGHDRNHGKHARHVGRSHKHKAMKSKTKKSKTKTAPAPAQKTEKPAEAPATPTSTASAAG